MTTIARELKQTPAARRIRLRGSVQGLGIRPTVARLARSLLLGGGVRNEMSGVVIAVTGSVDSLERFVEQLRRELPAGIALSQSDLEGDIDNHQPFRIESSDPMGPTGTIVPVDRIVCDACLKDVQTPGNRRFAYPFTSCTLCGPRYSILHCMPYDRQRTSMSVFVMCDLCRVEYEDPQDRRFHSQTNCCPACGPRIWSTDSRGRGVCSDQAAIQAAMVTLHAGQILAIKGIGGYQLICAAANEAAVARLRTAKRRPAKPLAVMVKRLGEAEELAQLSDRERESLRSSSGPIVIARSKPNSVLAAGIHPGLSDIGLMLPTTPLHLILLEAAGVPLVVTSGNVDGQPLEYQQRDAETGLAAVADRFLHHDREIVRPVDDSVVRCIADRVVTIRAARGIAPIPLEFKVDTTAIAVGGQQKVAIAISNGHQSVLGPHVGDLDSLASRQRFVDQTESLCRLYRCDADLLVHDSHPDYWTTQYDSARNRQSTQHHHAHIVAGMVEHGWLDKTVLGIAFDGTGLGTDTSIWGGEFLVASASGFNRVGHLRPFPLAGGEAAIRDPSRIAIALIRDTLGANCGPALNRIGIDNARCEAISALLHRPGLSPLTSSVGRLFDGVAAITLSDLRCSFDGEPAMLLEAACELTDQRSYEILISADVPRQLDWRPMIEQLLDDKWHRIAIGKMAMRFHRALAKAVVQMAEQVPQLPLILSGGVFQNRVLVELIVNSMRADQPLGLPGLIPPNDGGLAVGQLAVAAHMTSKGRTTRCV